VKTRADRLAADGLAWLSRRRAAGDRRPFLLYLQYMEPHGPYEPPEPFRSRFLRGSGDAQAAHRKHLASYYAQLSDEEVELLESLYDAEVASLDAGLAELFAGLKRLDLLRDTLVVVTADHGEAFYEHGLLGHGSTLFEESIRVPLIVVGPGVAAQHTVSEPVRLLDVAPTLLEMLALPPEPRFEGRSLVPLLARQTWRHPLDWLRTARAEHEAAPDVYLELPEYASALDLRRHSQALIRPPMKLLVTRIPANLTTKLPAGVEPGPAGPLTYDLASDAQELHPRPAPESAEGNALQEALHALSVAVAASANPAPEIQAVDEATRERLRALGYEVKR
jgi:arylsulfatase A-like enzyme